jgi:ankyrin repeat protein
MAPASVDAQALVTLSDGTPHGSGSTPMHFAVANGRMDIVKFLVASKAKLGIKDNSGKTPLMLANDREFWDIALLLEETIEADSLKIGQ